MKEPIKLIAQILEIKSRPDGSMRLVLECGLESLQGIQELMKKNANGEISFAVAMVDYDG